MKGITAFLLGMALAVGFAAVMAAVATAGVAAAVSFFSGVF